MDAMERLTTYLCSRPGSEGMDEFHRGFADQILRQHGRELAQAQRLTLERDPGISEENLIRVIDPDRRA